MSDSHEIGSQRGIVAAANMPAVYDITANIRDDLRSLTDDQLQITAKLDRIEATLANMQEQIQEIRTRVYSR